MTINGEFEDQLNEVNEVKVGKFTPLASYLAEVMDDEGESEITLGLNGSTFNIYTKCAACNKDLPAPVVVIEGGQGSVHVVDSDCRANVNLEDED